jgi:predicted ATPase
MIRSLVVEGYRTFERFHLEDLGRVNLLVGRNNCGKTSLLEAIRFLSTRGATSKLWASLVRRGERLVEEDETGRHSREPDIRHVFHGHEVTPGARIHVEAHSDEGFRWVGCRVAMAPDLAVEDTQRLPFSEDQQLNPDRLFLIVEGDPDVRRTVTPLSPRGILHRHHSVSTPAGPLVTDIGRTHFITVDALFADQVASLWQSVALTIEEDFVLDALRILEPRLDRLAFIGAELERGSQPHTRDGFFVRLSGTRKRIPLGSMGDGMWRMLGLALALSRCRDGVLLVDEIDVGLHYSVMEEMWNLVVGASERLRVQVFASTHSSDCVRSLSRLYERGNIEGKRSVSVQRIEEGHNKAVAFLDHEIGLIARQDIEVR